MIAVLIPTLNEGEAIKSVIEKFPSKYRGEEVEKYVIDGNSSDSTVENAKEAGAHVIHQTLDGGKGDAIREILAEVDADYYVMIDGDGTYDPEEVGKLLDPLLDGEAEHVIGARKNREADAIPFFNRIGNWFFNRATSVATGKEVSDMLSGYRAFTRNSIDYYGLTSPGFGIETEMTLSTLESNLPIKEVDINYSERIGESKLHPIEDGWRIFKTLMWSIRDLNPLKFFSGSAFLLLIIASYPSYLVFEQKLATGRVQDLGPVVFSAMLIILAVQLMIFGMLADQIRNTEKRLRMTQK
ncbi:glycosyltransferase [Candidatus Nanohalococcus occultus]|uniref:glycosyltransferase n=1 Tax=Candidatus Nanohalococcus occultus TaxID=2978047 RepID=UPI0039E1D0EF